MSCDHGVSLRKRCSKCTPPKPKTTCPAKGGTQAKRRAKGLVRVEAWLDPVIAAALEALRTRRNETTSQTIRAGVLLLFQMTDRPATTHLAMGAVKMISEMIAANKSGKPFTVSTDSKPVDPVLAATLKLANETPAPRRPLAKIQSTKKGSAT